jgi:NAD+ synthase
MALEPHAAPPPPRRIAQLLALDTRSEVGRIGTQIKKQVFVTLRRRGVVVAMSGGIDSSVVAALCTSALGASAVVGLAMPERDSPDEALRLSEALARQLGIRLLVEDIGPSLQALGCYSRQTDAIRTVFPDYGAGWRCKLTLPSLLEAERLSVFTLTVESPSGQRFSSRLPAQAYRQLLAATAFKQRTRKMLEYYHADRLGYAVAGTPNRLEHDQGFFVKQGDADADLKPIAHLYKTQVYAVAERLGIPLEIRSRPPSTDTFSLPQTQEEFFFSLPYATLDACLCGLDAGLSPAEVGAELGLSETQVERVFHDIEAKRRGTRYLHLPPLLIDGADPHEVTSASGAPGAWASPARPGGAAATAGLAAPGALRASEGALRVRHRRHRQPRRRPAALAVCPRPDARRPRAPRPRRAWRLVRPARRPRPRAPLDRRSFLRATAHGRRRRAARRQLQRRDLQPPGAPGRARRRRQDIPYELGHRGAPPGLAPLG